jgi:hypothetical protein
MANALYRRTSASWLPLKTIKSVGNEIDYDNANKYRPNNHTFHTQTPFTHTVHTHGSHTINTHSAPVKCLVSEMKNREMKTKRISPRLNAK